MPIDRTNPHNMSRNEIVSELARILRCAPNMLKQFSPSFNSYGDPLKLERALALVEALDIDLATQDAVED